jgi:CDP-paratose 2-epimerase
MKILITGGCGFVGANLAAEALHRGESLVVIDNLSRAGSEKNLRWLESIGAFRFMRLDIRNSEGVTEVVTHERPDVVFHMAGQVAMSSSIQDPRMDFETNTMGTMNLLEAVRLGAPDAIILYSSTNKVYGDLEQYTYRESQTRYICEEYPIGFDESLPLSFHSPYGCSKGAADQYLLDYSRIYGLRTAVFRHSSMYGERQYATYDQGWVGWFCSLAQKIQKGTLTEPFTISGSGKQVRDLLFADDVVALYFRAVEQIERLRGTAFNIGGGIQNSLSLLELFGKLEDELHIDMPFQSLPWRASDQKVFVAKNDLIRARIGWSPTTASSEGIRRMLGWLSQVDGT